MIRFTKVGVLALAAFALGGAAAPVAAAPVKFGVLSDVDSLPYLIARDEGLYQAVGVDVTLVPFQSPVERDAAFQSGAVDGVVGDVLGAALAVDHGFPVSIVAATDGRYLLLGGPNAKEAAVKDLANVPVAGSTNTVIHYLVDKFLTSAGVAPGEVKLVAIPKMPIRLEMLVGGQVDAAGLPEPMATVAQARGAKVLATSDGLGADPGVVLFSKAFVAAHPADVAAFLKAGAQAGQKVNAAPEKYRLYLTTHAGFPDEAAWNFKFVTYRPLRVPSDDAVNAITSWMVAKGLVKTAPAPSALVDKSVIAAALAK
jgi:NitT/TauT family transport system substrate-binding protein